MSDQNKLTAEEKTAISEAAAPLMTDIEEAMPYNTKEDKLTMKELVIASVIVGYKYAAKQTAEKDARIKELEEALKDLNTAAEHDLGEAKNQIENLTDELEEQKTTVKEHHDFCARQDAKRVEELEAVKKELLEKIEQLENADTLLRGAIPHLYNHGLASVRGEANEIRHFLSSRENKKPNE